MTALLIVAIIICIVWANDSVKKKSEAKQYENSTITNVKLEREIEIEWMGVIDEKLKEYDGDLDPFDYLLSLFDEYEVPKIRWNDPEDFIEEKRKQFNKDFEYLNEQFKRLIDQGFGVAPHLDVIYDSAPVDYIIGIHLDYFEDDRNWKNQNKEKFINYENVCKKTHNWFLYRYIEIKASGLTHYNHIINSDASFRLYSILIRLLTRKSLKVKGFNPSPDGKHESWWQESKKTHDRRVEEKEKYPWLK